MEDIQVLCALAEQGSLRAAGSALGVTQQAVSARMRRMENTLQLSLCERSPGGTRLTSNGEVVAGWAADSLASITQLMDGAATLRGGESSAMTVAASLTIAEYLLPRWMIKLRSLAADATVAVTAVNSAAVIERVSRGDHDLGFIETPDATHGLRTSKIAYDELIVVASPEHPWSYKRSVTVNELAHTPLVSRESGSGTRLFAERALASAGYGPLVSAAELPTSAAIRTAVIQGLAPAILSVLTVQEDIQLGHLVQVAVPELRMVRELRAVWRSDSDLSPSLRALLRIARGGQSDF